MKSGAVAAIARGRSVGGEEAVEGEDVAAGCSATTLITASVPDDVERVARRIHAASPRRACSFVQIAADALPDEPNGLRKVCTQLLNATNGGTLLLSGVENLPVAVQDGLFDTLAQVQAARHPATVVRLIAGTTASLHERVADGRFSDRLFYRLNIIHLRVPGTALKRSS